LQSQYSSINLKGQSQLLRMTFCGIRQQLTILDQKQIVEGVMMRTGIKHELWLVLWLALCASPAAATCITPPLAPEFISQFKLNPQSLIQTPDVDARTVEATTRDLAGTDPTLALDLVHVAKGAQPRFQAAIAAGLAQAALACLNVDQQGALQIQQAVASFEDGQFQALFAAVVGDLSTAATAAAESAATGSVGSVVIVNPAGKASPTSNPGGGGGALIVSSATGIFAVLGQSTSHTSAPNSLGTTAANPVSATH
jgi:hypothetical protein